MQSAQSQFIKYGFNGGELRLQSSHIRRHIRFGRHPFEHRYEDDCFSSVLNVSAVCILTDWVNWGYYIRGGYEEYIEEFLGEIWEGAGQWEGEEEDGHDFQRINTYYFEGLWSSVDPRGICPGNLAYVPGNVSFLLFYFFYLWEMKNPFF